MAEETRTDDGSSSSIQPVPDSPPNPQEPVSGSQVPPSNSLGNDPMHIPEGNTYGPGLHAILNDPMHIPEGNTYGPGLYAIVNDPLCESVTLLSLSAESSEGAGNEQEQEQKEQHEEEPIVRNAFNLNLTLIFKLAIIVLFLKQDESTNTFFLIFCAFLVYLYKMRLLGYFIWRLHQVGAHYLPENDPPPLDDVDGLNAGVDNLNQNPPGLNAGVDNLNQNPPGENQEQPNAGVDNLNPNQPDENQEQPNADVDNLNPNQPAENQEQPNANENNQQAEQRNNLVQVMREIQMLVVAFLLSLLPEVGNND